MGNLDVKYLFESQCELIDNIKELLKVLDGKKYGKELERLYEEFIDEIREHVYSKKESKKILVTLYFSLKIIKENIDKNMNIKEENFIIINNENKLLIEEFMDGIVINAKNEHEENKLKYYGYLLGNLIFKENLDRDESNRLIKISRSLSYCQIKLINMYIISQMIQVPILKREDYTKTGIENHRLLGVLQDTLDMIQKSILNGSGKLVLDIVQINPSKVKVQGIGTLLYNLMGLSKMPYDEMEDLLDILSNKN
ncbi:MAG: hypothetical protein E7E15_07985 [Terrisporobacter othiniensis]|uniref:hypothetical protein n=1 Tax=Terrisporobacter othiniensis TaxID=1577792 RepID=UPI0029011CC9|nr:hypothetical protein [Terrisporobacter othiniensis]MDU2200991.1 hypothetical protein [Terrisporobacter othiniensis]